MGIKFINLREQRIINIAITRSPDASRRRIHPLNFKDTITIEPNERGYALGLHRKLPFTHTDSGANVADIPRLTLSDLAGITFGQRMHIGKKQMTIDGVGISLTPLRREQL